MVGRPVVERQQTQMLAAAKRKAEENYINTPRGMYVTAEELRHDAGHMLDSNDRDAMLRIAVGYEQRAGDVERRLKRTPTET